MKLLYINIGRYFETIYNLRESKLIFGKNIRDGWRATPVSLLVF